MIKIKIFLGIALLIGCYFLFRKKKEATDSNIDNYSPNRLIARKKAGIIKSALGVKGSFWSWTEDEESVIKTLNANFSIQNLIAIEYKKITSNVLMDDITKYLSADDIKRINFNKI
jgi:hypothetical protein